MGTPVSEPFTPTPHQEFTALEFIRRVESFQQLTFDAPPSSPPKFFTGMKKDTKCHYGGKFKWDSSSKTGKTVKTIFGSKTEWETKYVLEYYPLVLGETYRIRYVTCEKLLIFTCRNIERVAHWHERTKQWILADFWNESQID